MSDLWENAHYETKLRILEGQSFVSIGLLLEDMELIRMIKRGDSQEDCFTYIQENF